MHTLLFIFFIFSITLAKAAEGSSPFSIQTSQVEKLDWTEHLNKANYLKEKKPQISTQLASEALHMSKANNNDNLSAQLYFLLGELALESNSIVPSIKYFIQSSFIYKSIGNDRYREADRIIDELLPFAQESEETLPIALTLIAAGDGDYKSKRYDDAISQYSYALKFLSTPDIATQKKRAETYKKIAQSYKRLKNREQTASFYKKALQAFTAQQDLKNIARTLNTLAEAERYLNDYVTALDYSVQSLEIYKRINDPAGYANALNGAGIIYRHIGLYDKSLQHVYEAHRYYNEVKDVSGIAKTSNQMGLIYTRLEQFEQARSFYQLTIELPQDKIASKTRASALREIAVIDLDAGNYESAKEMAKKAYYIYQSNNDKIKQSLTARIIGNVYRAKLNIDEATVYYRESLSIATEIGSKEYQVKALTPLAATLFHSDIDESIALLKKALLLAGEIDSNSSKLYAYRELRKAEKLRGNYHAALGYAEKEISFMGAIEGEKSNNDLAVMKAKLYSHKKEMELESLREETKRNELELAKKNHEIELVKQARKITELELLKKEYASIALAFLLLLCVLIAIFIYRRFIDYRKQNRELDNLAARDPLTNCYNRRILFVNMDRDFESLDVLEEYCIIMIDIDHFKAVNDTYGHSVGDSVICGVASILQDCVRKSDVVTRYGGEEFCVVLYRIPQSKALEIAEMMRAAVENTRFSEIAITCSFGVTSIRFNAKSPLELINQADLALYKSKSLGRNKVTMWHEDFKK